MLVHEETFATWVLTYPGELLLLQTWWLRAERFDRDMDLQLAERITVFVFSRRWHFVGTDL